MTCVNFTYNLEKNYVSKCTGEQGIGFEISRIELICFEPGICFLIIKAQLDKQDNLTSSKVLDFNYKFRTINPHYLRRKKTDGIFLNNMEFACVGDLSDFIEGLLYGYEDVEQENIYFDRLFTYSYVCLDQSEWNEHRHLERIINEFYKFQYVLPGDYSSTFDENFKGVKDNTYTRWKYSLYGFSREAGVVFSSARENFSCTKLPIYFESMYLYLFIIAFYQRIALILFSQQLMSSGKKKIEDLKDRFTRFTHFSWFSQITNSEQGMDLWKKWQKAFDLPDLFEEVQKEYAEYYDYTVAQGQEKINTLLIIIYVLSVVFSAMSLLVSFNIINTNNGLMKMLVEVLLSATVLIYPSYLGARVIKRLVDRGKGPA